MGRQTRTSYFDKEVNGGADTVKTEVSLIGNSVSDIFTYRRGNEEIYFQADELEILFGMLESFPEKYR